MRIASACWQEGFWQTWNTRLFLCSHTIPISKSSLRCLALFTYHFAIKNIPSFGNQLISWRTCSMDTLVLYSPTYKYPMRLHLTSQIAYNVLSYTWLHTWIFRQWSFGHIHTYFYQTALIQLYIYTHTCIYIVTWRLKDGTANREVIHCRATAIKHVYTTCANNTMAISTQQPA
jgi:hypothetical protein